ncbi:CoA transferase [Ferrimicrobium sp.]|uniref:CaiB/BaiF CoA transferase family protein n=1 Tax=Ferrimicrobium sp. TaxID=2926050 RepID=UPI00262F40D3|nr:CoA transferase [Ferrimicrobium sp.]
MADDESQERLPLQDLRVIEMGQLLAGPFCGQLLADFGADVIKVEDPNRGDPMRQWGREKPHGLSLWWPVVARGKRSVTIDLRNEEGQELVRSLVAQSDILLENFRPGTLERWGLDYHTLAEINPGLILVRVTGYGQTGPYAGRAGFGSIGEAMGGIRYVTGNPEAPPSRAGISIGDSLAAIFAALGALVAVHNRSVTGKGQVVDTAIYEAVLSMMESLIPEYTLGHYIRERTGAILPNVAPSNIYPTKDGLLLLIAANQDSVFGRLALAMGQPELADDPRFATHGARGANQVVLDELIAEWTRRYDTAELEELLQAHGVPEGKIYRAPEMLADPHFMARQDIISLEHPTLGAFQMHNVAPRLSATPGRVRWVGPELGEHTVEVLGGLLGLSGDAIASLRQRGVI